MASVVAKLGAKRSSWRKHRRRGVRQWCPCSRIWWWTERLPGRPEWEGSYGVPNLQLDGEVMEVDGLGGKLDPDGGLAFGTELLVQELHHDW